MSAKFQFTETQMGSALKLDFSGPLDEATVFPKVNPAVTAITINLREATRLNSNGARAWIVWISSISPKIPIVLEECPVIMVKSFALIKGVLTPNMEVTSFYVPYTSDNSNERATVLFEKGRHYFQDGRIELPVVKDSQGDPMDLDVIQDSYFSFLKR
jgi:hypothetical protein